MDALVLMFQAKFGEVSNTTIETRLRRIEPEKVQTYMERILQAKSPDDIFRGV